MKGGFRFSTLFKARAAIKMEELGFQRFPGFSGTYVSPYIEPQLDKIFLSAEVSPANYGAGSIRY